MLNVNDLVNRKVAILALSQCKGIGFFTIRKLYNSYKRLEEFKNLPFDELEKNFVKAKVSYAERLTRDFFDGRERFFKEASEVYDKLINTNKIFILDEEEIFPNTLRRIPERPFWLFAQGNLSLLNNDNLVAIVGTRNPTLKGLELTKKVAELLVRENCVIVSGLAEGIDAVAHDVTNKLKGKGVAILGTGINIAFPAKTKNIRRELIANEGLTITEYFPDSNYSKLNFVFRDRLQSGISKAVLPIQAPIKSGTFHTVKYAEAQKRRVIGLYLDKIEDVRQSEVLAYLKQKNYPVYDFSKEYNLLLEEIRNAKIDKPVLDEQTLFDFEKRDIADKEFKKVEKELGKGKSFLRKLIELFGGRLIGR